MSPENKKLSWNEVRTTCAINIVIGAVLLFISANYTYITSLISDGYLKNIILKLEGTIYGTGLMFLLVGIFVIASKNIFSFVWDSTIGKVSELLINIVEISMGKIVKDVGLVSNNIDVYIKQRGGPLMLHECKDIDDYKQYVQHAYSNIYGRHVVDEKSLNSFVKHRILDAFCCDPHRSQIHKKIILSKSAKHGGYLDWRETTQYKIHHVMFGTYRTPGVFDLDTRISSYAPGLTEQEWGGALSLTIIINSQALLNKTESPKFEENNMNEGFYCWKKGDWIYLRYCKKIALNQEWTDVEISEVSINCEDDQSYHTNTTKPICGQTVEFELPEEYEFIDCKLTPQILFDGLPEHLKKGLTRDDFVKTTSGGKNHLRIEIKDWILPGIVSTLYWKKND